MIGSKASRSPPEKVPEVMASMAALSSASVAVVGARVVAALA